MEKQLLNVLLFQICYSTWSLRRNPDFDCLNRTNKTAESTVSFIQYICKMTHDCFPPHLLNLKKAIWIFSLTNKSIHQKNPHLKYFSRVFTSALEPLSILLNIVLISTPSVTILLLAFIFFFFFFNLKSELRGF